MKKELSLLVTITSLTLVLVGCNDNGVKPVDPNVDQNTLVDTSKGSSSYQSLAGTRDWWAVWDKPSRYGDKLYTLEFKKDGTFTTYSWVNEFHGTYAVVTRENVYKILSIGGTKVGGPNDLWWDIHPVGEMFTVQENELRLSYNNSKSCLVFKPLAVANEQENRLIYPTEVPNAAEKANEILQKSPAYVSVDFVTIDLGKINDYEQFTLQFGNRTIHVTKEQVILRSSNSYTFIGRNSSGDQVSLSVLGNDIQGLIETTTGVFSIMTVGNNEYAVVKVDQSKLRDEPDDWNTGIIYPSMEGR